MTKGRFLCFRMAVDDPNLTNALCISLGSFVNG